MFRVFLGRPAAKTLHRTMAFDLVSSLHSDSLLFLAENDPRHSMAGVESRYFLRINGHPPRRIGRHYATYRYLSGETQPSPIQTKWLQ